MRDADFARPLAGKSKKAAPAFNKSAQIYIAKPASLAAAAQTELSCPGLSFPEGLA
ncbi:hypothetical protein ML401_04985 [Bradyrhizobium sp. 62B]|uniref:hypothetical protein n=1 Tax=Bradyrhizobium sp. 62B TaxID=2898442 RepID=UPI002557EE5F|nr:hypothetical protein ML401_04985 [Bradyrhizobium sp. 62B]